MIYMVMVGKAESKAQNLIDIISIQSQNKINSVVLIKAKENFAQGGEHVLP